MKEEVNMKFNYDSGFRTNHISNHSTSPPQIDRKRKKSAPEITTLAVFSQGWKLILSAVRNVLSM